MDYIEKHVRKFLRVPEGFIVGSKPRGSMSVLRAQALRTAAYILLNKCKMNIAEIARVLNLKENTVYKYMIEFDRPIIGENIYKDQVIKCIESFKA